MRNISLAGLTPYDMTTIPSVTGFFNISNRLVIQGELSRMAYLQNNATLLFLPSILVLLGGTHVPALGNNRPPT
jgi:hypothetical protein